MAGCLRSPGATLLRSFEASRRTTLQSLLQSAVTAAIAESNKDGGGQVHGQCALDFHRGLYCVGSREFLYGDQLDHGSKCKDRAYKEFINCMVEECWQLNTMIYATSLLTSQIAMAHLGNVCFSGPHRYAISSGCTRPCFAVRRRGTDIQVTLDRVSEGFTCFAVPGGDEIECHNQSMIRQHATILLRHEAGDTVGVVVECAWEAMDLKWPSARPVVDSGLKLEFRSPPEAPLADVLLSFSRRLRQSGCSLLICFWLQAISVARAFGFAFAYIMARARLALGSRKLVRIIVLCLLSLMLSIAVGTTRTFSSPATVASSVPRLRGPGKSDEPPHVAASAGLDTTAEMTSADRAVLHAVGRLVVGLLLGLLAFFHFRERASSERDSGLVIPPTFFGSSQNRNGHVGESC